MKRTAVAVSIALLLVTGCSLFGSGDSEKITTEASFRSIDVLQFAHNRLVFEGIQKDEKAVYIYDMHQKTLSRKHGDADWRQDDHRLYYLNDNRKLVLEQSDNVERIFLTDTDGNNIQVVRAPVNSGLQYSVAPNDVSMLYWTKDGSETNLYFYDLVRGSEKSVTSLSGALRHDDIAWAANGKYVIIKDHVVYNVSEGKEVLELESSQAIWSPTETQLLVVEKEFNSSKSLKEDDVTYGNRIMSVDVVSGQKEQLFPVKSMDSPSSENSTETEPVPLILDQPVWDGQGRYFAFITGSMNGEQIVYEQVHVMDAAGGFHHIENEQNLRPSVIAGLSFDPTSNLFSYTAGGLLKVVHLPTQQSKVFDVYTQMQQGEHHYLKYNNDDAWVLADGEIKRLSNGLEEKTIYRSEHELRDFFVQSNGDHILVIERDSDHYQLKLISLLEEETGK